ncbi:PAS domain-containing protein [Spirosoma endophyticum]|nr:PAS domain-containing protein [Spirosoma endophyticum]
MSIPDGWSLLRLALRTNHHQELIDNQAAEEQAKFRLDQRHQREMAQVSLFLNPLGWAQTINRYTAQQAQSQMINKFRRKLTLTRQQTESVELDVWIAQQQQQATDMVLFEQLHQLFSWSLTPPQQHAYYQSLSQGDTLIITDLQKNILWTSQNFESLTGYPLEEVVGKSTKLLQGPGTDRTTVQYVGEQLASSQPVEVELLNYRKGGSPYLCYMHIEPLYSRQGALTHFSAIERDVK